MKKIFPFIVVLTLIACNNSESENNVSERESYLKYDKNVLDYRHSPKDSLDKEGLMFSDQGAWFAYSFPESASKVAGFSGPFLMTQQNGIWASASLSNLSLRSENNTNIIDWDASLVSQTSASHGLTQLFKNDSIQITQHLVFSSGHTVIQQTKIENLSSKGITIHPSISGELFDIGLKISEENETIMFSSEKSDAMGYLNFPGASPAIMTTDNYYNAHFETLYLEPNAVHNISCTQTFIFPEYSWEKEKEAIHNMRFDSVLKVRRTEKDRQLVELLAQRRSSFQSDSLARVLAKAQLTLQNNWRIPAGEIKHEGLFPSYHYTWFNGFWSWDSWKHAVGLSYYNMDLAKKQVRLMFEFQNNDGFVADCVYRDTTIEAHNYRNTKPPLSAWAVATIYDKDGDLAFVKDMYPKLLKYHQWWYAKRDHDGDSLCEYGATDGSLIAAKWESGMDNAIRFDASKIVKNEEGAFSLDQESVDLNAYLYAEKRYLASLAKALQKTEESSQFNLEAERLKEKIQSQFYDPQDGWFYDTNLNGDTFIKGEGSEGWTALWAMVATQRQAEAVKQKMMDPKKFYTKVPFQTMSADHPRFDPLKGYWRGPNWLDQAYFGVKGLRNYGFNEEANAATLQILTGAQGVMVDGKSIRENYHPITGEGLNAQNFSWSAAHIIMLLLNE